MSSSLRDQLLQAGLVPTERTKKTVQKKKITPSQKNKPQKRKKQPQPASDLAQFYRQRTTQERSEKQEIERKRQAAAKLKKEQHRKIRQLLNKHKLDNTHADIRYNFVVNTTIKYIFVTTEQQKHLEQGKLAITFQAGQSCLIPYEIGKELLSITPHKLVIFQEDEK
jgi:uncharacterized protein YaiL (DUF2058 family)